jgi:hypothetical protein
MSNSTSITTNNGTRYHHEHYRQHNQFPITDAANELRS